MKRIPAIAVVVGLCILSGSKSYSGAHWPDVCLVAGETGSVLCAGLVEHFELSDVSDSPRFGAGMSYLQEAPGQNVAVDTVGQGVGTGAADFDGTTTKWLWANASAPTETFTVTFRVKIQAAVGGADQLIFSWYNNNFVGPHVFFDDAATDRICLAVFEAEVGVTYREACQNAVIGTWYFVTVGSSRFHDGKANIFISLNDAARTTTAVTYWQQGGPSYMRISGHPSTGPGNVSVLPADMLLAELDFFTRPISNYEQTLLYNGGGAPSNALVFPYDTN